MRPNPDGPDAATIGIDLQREIDRGRLEIWYGSPQEMEIDRHFAELPEART